ncbi:facilitated trehalose transporter Tret1 [Drosophila elegans]|uniref:facilitated trehalose transporter Tret1 n=1 Tax=Drosophila elegans TaxID=30023 RepID=UPI001BC8303F|nr:facilitated trehalose transporter Tret1 [Drosophila elegans]
MLMKLFQRPNCLLNRRNRYQLLTTLLINAISISHGIGIGWLSPTLRKLQSDSPVSFEVKSAFEISWVGSMLGMGSVTGNILIGCLLERLGSKRCLLFIAIPHSCLWILVYFAQSVEYLYVGRLLAGICGGGMYIVHPIFLSEIADANIRGTFSAMVMLSVNVGILVGYIMGTHMAYYSIPWIVLILPLCYFISVLLFIKESPMHLIRIGKYSAAERSFRYYKNIKDSDNIHDQNRAMEEFEHMKISLTKGDPLKDAITFKDFCTRPALKAYGPALVLLIANQFSGLFTMVNYMSDIFANSGSTMDPDTCTIIIGAVQILGTYVTTLLCDICGRKLLMLVSTAGVAISLTAFGFFTQYAKNHDVGECSWIPLLLMSMDIFLGNIGLVGCFFVSLVEMFPVKIRAKAASMAIVVCSSFVFVMLNIFPICMKEWGISATMWSCAGVTAFSFVYFTYFMKETKGKSMLDD